MCQELMQDQIPGRRRSFIPMDGRPNDNIGVQNVLCLSRHLVTVDC